MKLKLLIGIAAAMLAISAAASGELRPAVVQDYNEHLAALFASHLRDLF